MPWHSSKNIKANRLVKFIYTQNVKNNKLVVFIASVFRRLLLIQVLYMYQIISDVNKRLKR